VSPLAPADTCGRERASRRWRRAQLRVVLAKRAVVRVDGSITSTWTGVVHRIAHVSTVSFAGRYTACGLRYAVTLADACPQVPTCVWCVANIDRNADFFDRFNLTNPCCEITIGDP
jgi:hypothetical protein